MTKSRWLGLGLLACMVLVGVAEARVGGGQGFSGSSSGGGGDNEFLIDIFFLLIHLCIDYPKIGLPILALFLLFVVIRLIWQASSSARRVIENHAVSTAAPTGRKPDRERLLQQDSAFSETVFLDFAALVQRRAIAAKGNFSVLGPFVGQDLQQQLARYTWVDEVIVGGVTLESVKTGSPQQITVDFITLYVGAGKRELVQASWVFQREAGTLSLPPERTLSLACPNCGNPAETTKFGTCVTCGTPNTAGQLQWQAVAMRVRSEGAAPKPALGLNQGGVEQSAKLSSRLQPQLTVELRKLVGRHPDFSKQAFKDRVEHVYFALQRSWSANDWGAARPFVTDMLYQQLRFWVDDYARNGLRNQLTDVELNDTQIVRVEVDAWFEAITVRIWGQMKDSVVDGKGAVVAGNDRQARVFSEYWTFLRAAGTGAASGDPSTCPSCAAPLDNVGSNGVCNYCDAKLSSGRYDWVLARIEQPEAYRG